MATGEEVRDRLAERLLGRLDDTAVALTVTDLAVIERGPYFTAVFVLDAPDGRWRVTLDSDHADMNIFSGTPDPELTQAVASSFAIRLAEWWYSKRTEPEATRQGQRIA